MFSRFKVAKPEAEASMLYMPGFKNGIVYIPLAFVFASVVSFVSTRVALTVALGMAEPDGSVTCPRIVARKSWADNRPQNRTADAAVRKMCMKISPKLVLKP